MPNILDEDSDFSRLFPDVTQHLQTVPKLDTESFSSDDESNHVDEATASPEYSVSEVSSPAKDLTLNLHSPTSIGMKAELNEPSFNLICKNEIDLFQHAPNKEVKMLPTLFENKAALVAGKINVRLQTMLGHKQNYEFLSSSKNYLAYVARGNLVRLIHLKTVKNIKVIPRFFSQLPKELQDRASVALSVTNLKLIDLGNEAILILCFNVGVVEIFKIVFPNQKSGQIQSSHLLTLGFYESTFVKGLQQALDALLFETQPNSLHVLVSPTTLLLQDATASYGCAVKDILQYRANTSSNISAGVCVKDMTDLFQQLDFTSGYSIVTSPSLDRLYCANTSGDSVYEVRSSGEVKRYLLRSDDKVLAVQEVGEHSMLVLYYSVSDLCKIRGLIVDTASHQTQAHLYFELNGLVQDYCVQVEADVMIIASSAGSQDGGSVLILKVETGKALLGKFETLTPVTSVSYSSGKAYTMEKDKVLSYAVDMHQADPYILWSKTSPTLESPKSQLDIELELEASSPPALIRKKPVPIVQDEPKADADLKSLVTQLTTSFKQLSKTVSGLERQIATLTKKEEHGKQANASNPRLDKKFEDLFMHQLVPAMSSGVGEMSQQVLSHIAKGEKRKQALENRLQGVETRLEELKALVVSISASDTSSTMIVTNREKEIGRLLKAKQVDVGAALGVLFSKESIYAEIGEAKKHQLLMKLLLHWQASSSEEPLSASLVLGVFFTIVQILQHFDFSAQTDLAKAQAHLGAQVRFVVKGCILLDNAAEAEPSSQYVAPVCRELGLALKAFMPKIQRILILPASLKDEFNTAMMLLKSLGKP